jgi:hypothetical protein
MQSEKENKYFKSNEITLRELIKIIVSWISFLKSKWIKISLVGLFGGIIGFIYAFLQPISYTAKLTFVVEEGKTATSGLGGLASLAGQFGVDVGGAGGGGVLSGDNILLYFKSESLAREVLLTKFDSTTSLTLADVYANVYKLRNKWIKNEKIGNVSFQSEASTKFSRVQDSLISSMVQEILTGRFNVIKTDKKAGFIEVRTTMLNEQLSKIYCERIVKVAIDRYINIKTERQKATVSKLQARVDSIASLLTKKTASSAQLQTSSTTMDINPIYKTGTSVAVETNLRDKTMLSTIFASVVQNLEIAKFALSQETPVIQIVDPIYFPLIKNQVSKKNTAFIGAVFFGLSFSIFLLSKKFIRLN